MKTLTKYATRTKLQAAILAVLLVVANKAFDLGLSQTELTAAVLGLVGYIIGESMVDAAALKQPSK